jgi:hypothetical protein
VPVFLVEPGERFEKEPCDRAREQHERGSVHAAPRPCPIERETRPLPREQEGERRALKKILIVVRDFVVRRDPEKQEQASEESENETDQREQGAEKRA